MGGQNVARDGGQNVAGMGSKRRKLTSGASLPQGLQIAENKIKQVFCKNTARARVPCGYVNNSQKRSSEIFRNTIEKMDFWFLKIHLPRNLF